MKDNRYFYCSFCGKSQHEVDKLVAGPTVHICNECVDLCHTIVHDRPLPPLVPEPALPFDEWRISIATIETTLMKLRHAFDRAQWPVRPREPAPLGQVIGFGEALSSDALGDKEK